MTKETDALAITVQREMSERINEISELNMRLHKLEGDIAILKQLAPTKTDLPY